MLKKLLLLAALTVSPAFGQGSSVQYVSPVTRGHVPVWNTNGVIADGGSSADSPITSIGVTNNGGAGICVNSARITAPGGYNALCFGAQTAGPAIISLQNFGSATAQTLEFILNGVINIPAAIPVGAVPSDLVSFGPNNSLLDSGLAAAGGVISKGVWGGTSVSINFGGTGATSQAGAQTNLGIGTLGLQNFNSVSIAGGLITGASVTGLPAPAVSSDAATKSYVDATATGLNILAPSGLATAAVLPNTPTYANGTAGVGATLTAGSNTTLTVDGTAAVLNTVVLVKNQASAFQNGIYTVTQAGTGSVPWILTRATYFDQAAEMKAGSYTFISGGSVNINSSWTMQTAVTTVGTDPLNFVQFSSGSSGTVTSVATGTGLTGGPITGSGTIALAAGAATANIGTLGGYLSGTLPNPTINTTFLDDPKSGLFVPLITGTVSGVACNVGSPFNCMQFCQFKGNLIVVNGAYVTIPSGGCVGATGGIMAAVTNACIENASFVTTCSQTLSNNTLYYVYVGLVSATPTMIFSPNVYNYSTSANGNAVMNGDSTRSLIGLLQTDPSAPTIAGTASQQNEASWFNSVNDGLVATASGTFSNSAAYTNLTGGQLSYVQFSNNVPTLAMTCVSNSNAASFPTFGIGVSTTGGLPTVPSAITQIASEGGGSLTRQAAVNQSGVIGFEGHVIATLMGLATGSSVVTVSSCTLQSPSRIPS